MLVDRLPAETSAFQALRSEKQINNTANAVTRIGNKGLLATDPHTCCFCKKVISSRHGLKKHIERFHRKITKFSCDLCPKFYFVKNELKIHMNRVHLKSYEKLHCNLCDYKTTKKHLLKNHEKKHRDKIECSICGKLVMNMKFHLHVHEGKEQCSICQKMVQKRNMKNHMKRIHVAKKCKSCDETFLIKKELRRWVFYLIAFKQFSLISLSDTRWKNIPQGKFLSVIVDQFFLLNSV